MKHFQFSDMQGCQVYLPAEKLNALSTTESGGETRFWISTAYKQWVEICATEFWDLVEQLKSL